MLWVYLWIAIVLVLIVIRLALHWRIGREEPSPGQFIALCVTGMCLVVGVGITTAILWALS